MIVVAFSFVLNSIAAWKSIVGSVKAVELYYKLRRTLRAMKSGDCTDKKEAMHNLRVLRNLPRSVLSSTCSLFLVLKETLQSQGPESQLCLGLQFTCDSSFGHA